MKFSILSVLLFVSVFVGLSDPGVTYNATTKVVSPTGLVVKSPSADNITITGPVSGAQAATTVAYVTAAIAGVSGSTAGTAPRALADTLAFDGSTTNARAYWNIGVNGDLNTSPLSVVALVGNDSVSAASGTRGIWNLSSSSAAPNANSLQLYRDANNLWIQFSGTDNSNAKRLYFTNFFTTYSARDIPLVVTWDRLSAPKVYADGTLLAMTVSDVGVAPAWTDPIGATYFMVGAKNSTFIWNGRLMAQPLNVVLTASEITQHAVSGQLPLYAASSSATTRYTSNFGSGADGWLLDTSGTGGAVAGNLNPVGIPPTSNPLGITCAVTTVSQYTSAYRSGLVTGKRYKVKLSYYIPPAQNANSIVLRSNPSLVIGTLSTIGSWTTYSSEFTATDFYLRIFPASGSSIYFSDPGTSVVYLKDVTFNELGPVFTPVVQVTRIVDDASDNNISGVLTTGVNHITLKKSWRIRAAVDTSAIANVQVLGSALFTNPIRHVIDFIDTNCTGTPTFSLGDGTTTTKYTASVAHTAIRLRESISSNFPADAAKTGIYANVTAASAGTVITIRGHLID